MFSNITVALSLLFATRLALAGSGPPPCLLAAVNTQPNPADIKGICSQNATMVENTIASVCGNDTNSALSAFYSTCSSASVSVSTYVVSTKSSGSGTDATATLSNGGTAATATTTGSSGSKTSASAAGAAGKLELGFGAAVALAAAGLLNVV